MYKIFEFNFKDIYNITYVINIYDKTLSQPVTVGTATLTSEGFILNYSKENSDILQGGIIKSELEFSLIKNNNLSTFLQNLQIYENRYFVDILKNGSLFWRGVLLNDFGTFEDSKFQVVTLKATDGLGILQNIDYIDDFVGGNSETFTFINSYPLGLIDYISLCLANNPVVNFFTLDDEYIRFRSNYKSDGVINEPFDMLAYTWLFKVREDTTQMSTAFANYSVKQKLNGEFYRIWERDKCYDVLEKCLKLFNLCLVQHDGIWEVFNINYMFSNYDNYQYFYATYNPYNYRNLHKGEFVANNYDIRKIIDNVNIKRTDGNFTLNSSLKKLKQKYIPYFLNDNDYNNLIFAGLIAQNVYCYPTGVIVKDGSIWRKEDNFNDFNLCKKYHYHNSIGIDASMMKCQFKINFTFKYPWAGTGFVNTSLIKPYLDINLKVNGKWLDSNGNLVDTLPSGGWLHNFHSNLTGNSDGNILITFTKYFEFIPESASDLNIDFYFRAYTHMYYNDIEPKKFSELHQNSILKIVNQDGTELEYVLFESENSEDALLELDWEDVFVDDISLSQDSNILLTIQEFDGANYIYRKSKKWYTDDDTNLYNLATVRLNEIMAMNSHPLLRWSGTLYYLNNDMINYFSLYLMKYNLQLQDYIMFPERWTFYARESKAECELVEVGKDYMKVVSGGELVSKDMVPVVQDVDYLNIIVSRENGELVLNSNSLRIGKGATNIIEIIDKDNNKIGVIDFDKVNKTFIFKNTDANGDLVELVNMAEVSRYLKDSICRYDKYDYAIIECFLEDDTEIAFPDYTYFNGLRAFPVNEIKNAVFRYIKFTGDFTMNNLEIANDYEFYTSVFNGDFNCPNLLTVGQYAFRNSNFTGVFNCPNLTTVGGDAFRYSVFDGAFDCPNLQTVGDRAFRNSVFNGAFDCPNLTTVGNSAFYYSVFTGNFNCPNLQAVGIGAFYYSVFDGAFNCPNLQEVGDAAFYYSVFNGEFNCPDLQAVGDRAFRNSVFTGDFNCPNLTSVSNYAFQNSVFNGVFNCPNLQAVGNNAFRNSVFTGNFDCQELQEVGNSAFLYSQFNGDFNCPNLQTVGQYTFRNSNFTGVFNCPNLTTVGNEAFRNSQFDGAFNCPNVTTVDNYAFENSQFTGDFNCPNLQTVGQYAFRNSNFTGVFNCPNLTTVGNEAFRNSQFDGAFNCPNVTTVDNYAFENSQFTGDFNCPNLQTVGQYAFRSSQFDGVFNCPNLQAVGDEAFVSSQFTGKFNCPNLQTVGDVAFENSVFTGAFECPNLTTIGNNAFYYSQFDGVFNCPNLQAVGIGAFYLSQFNGVFDCPNLQTVGELAFLNSVFTGEFNCPNLQAVGDEAFVSSQFTGKFNCPNLQAVGIGAFYLSQFNGVFDCPNLQTIGNYAFLNSVFTGAFECPNLQTVGDYAFLHSTFDTITIGANATLGTGCIGAHSAEFINDYAANGKLAGTYVWDAGTNHWIYQG